MDGANVDLDQSVDLDWTQQNERIYQKLARECGVLASQVASFAALYDDGNSVPFIARYRKEKTGGLDDGVLRQLQQKLEEERALSLLRAKTAALLKNQNALTDELSVRLDAAQSKLAIEEIYAPYRQKRRSLAHKARLALLDTPAERVLDGLSPSEALQGYEPPSQARDDTGEIVEIDYSTPEKQNEGLAAIVVDRWATDLELLDKLRTQFAAGAQLRSALVVDLESANAKTRREAEKLRDYFDRSEAFAKLPSHRLLAMLRGRQKNLLSLQIQNDDAPFVDQIAERFGATGSGERGQFLRDCAKKLWLERWRPRAERRLLSERRGRAEKEAIGVFANNLKHLLMAAPVGAKRILGVDPGVRHGVKMAAIDETGNPLATAIVYPFTDKSDAAAKDAIAQLIDERKIDLVAIGDGTQSRETYALIKDVLKERRLTAKAVVVSEAGASVYSASELAGAELGDLDVSLRGAVCIARRAQDPLAELVKIDPKSIGAGQYQHDVNQSDLEQSLAFVTEDCVNAVGVDVNTASPSLLAYVAGLNKNVAEQIVRYRRENGAFANRQSLKNVPRMGEKTFLQAAGFLRVKSSNEPLDATGVHPEDYDRVYALLKAHNLCVNDAIGNPSVVEQLRQGVAPLSPESLALAELGKARHDPRGEFVCANFRDDVRSIDDLQVGMRLEGVVTNVTAFGCFVDIGVGKNGLVHVSEFNTRPAKNKDAVKPFDIVQVRVIGIDKEHDRISLSLRPAQRRERATDTPRQKAQKTHKKSKTPAPSKVGSFGALLQQAGVGKN